MQAAKGVLGFGAKKAWQWPADLMPLAYALYHFQRGPLLGLPTPLGTPLGATSDERLSLMNVLLWSAWADAYRIMSPKLYAVLSPGGQDGHPPPEHQQGM